MNKKPLKINDWVFDSENKEFVKITNMRCPICALGKENPVTLNLAHHTHEPNHDEKYMVPFEAVAIRFLGLSAGIPSLGFTYRGVDHTKLSPTNSDMGSFEQVLQTTGKSNHFSFIGRV